MAFSAPGQLYLIWRFLGGAKCKCHDRVWSFMAEEERNLL